MANTEIMTKEQLADHEILLKLASDIAVDVAKRINKDAPKLPATPTMPYRQKYVLEEVIQLLEAKV